MSNGFSRRGFLKGLASAAGAYAGARLPGGSRGGLVGEALAAGEPTSILILNLIGGYNAIFGSARELQGSFGVTAGNFTGLGGGLTVDNTFASSMSPFVLKHMAAVGVRHGISSHPAAQAANMSFQNQNAALQLANAIGGTGSIKAAIMGQNLDPDIPRGAVSGTSFQAITDMQKTIEALGGGAPDPRVPDRDVAVSGMTNAQVMSGNAIAGSPESLVSLTNGYGAAIATLKQPVQKFDFNELKTAYTLGAGTAIRSFESKIAGAELMVRAGTNVVMVQDGGWDTHGDNNGATVRNKMTSYVLPALNTFMKRMVEDANRNVVVLIMGDFSRSLPGSNHQPNLTATVIGRYVKTGTTGRVNADVALPTGTPGVAGLWSYLAKVTRAQNSPFGANQHPTLAL